MASLPVFQSDTLTLTAVGPAVDAVSRPILVGPTDEVTLTFTRDAGSAPTLAIYVSNDPLQVAFNAPGTPMTLEAGISTASPVVLTGSRGRFGRYWLKGVGIGADKFLKVHVTRSRPF